MTFRLSNTVKTAALAGVLGLAGVAASGTAASAHYIQTRCYGDHCRVVRCDNDGDDCYTIRAFYRGDRYDRDWRWRHRRHWVCDRGGDDCHWVYGRRYWHRGPHFGVNFGWHD